jgi:Raf kinase inhibitor-like YbhB/YbcL family protein
MKLAYLLAPLLILTACGDDDDDTADTTDNTPTIDSAVGTIDSSTPAIDGAPGPDAAQIAFELTSTAVAEGGMLPDVYTCDGDNISPPLAWTAGPAGTLSYAITFIDLDFMFPPGYEHSTIYDIPSSVLSLPEDIENVYEPAEVPGAKQSKSYQKDRLGYNGPCPGNTIHTYQFTLHALDVATLPGLSATTTVEQAVAAIQAHSIASATLNVESN